MLKEFQKHCLSNGLCKKIIVLLWSDAMINLKRKVSPFNGKGVSQKLELYCIFVFFFFRVDNCIMYSINCGFR